MTRDLCLIKDCGDNAVTRGLCNRHYKQAVKDGTLEQVARPRRRPAVERYGDRALELWESGMPLAHIAAELGTSGPTIRDVLQKLGIENPGRRSPRARMLENSRNQVDQIDHLEPLQAVLQAWTQPDQDPEIAEAAREEVRQVMPLLARALGRL